MVSRFKLSRICRLLEPGNESLCSGSESSQLRRMADSTPTVVDSAALPSRHALHSPGPLQHQGHFFEVKPLSIATSMRSLSGNCSALAQSRVGGQRQSRDSLATLHFADTFSQTTGTLCVIFSLAQNVGVVVRNFCGKSFSSSKLGLLIPQHTGRAPRQSAKIGSSASRLWLSIPSRDTSPQISAASTAAIDGRVLLLRLLAGLMETTIADSERVSAFRRSMGATRPKLVSAHHCHGIADGDHIGTRPDRGMRTRRSLRMAVRSAARVPCPVTAEHQSDKVHPKIKIAPGARIALNRTQRFCENVSVAATCSGPKNGSTDIPRRTTVSDTEPGQKQGPLVMN